MCLGVPARVIDVDAAGATLDDRGRRRRASIFRVPDVEPGDWVLVAAGMVVRRLDSTEAEALIAAIVRAEARTPTASARGGTP